MAQESSLCVDDFYFSALSDQTETEIFPVSDSKYAEELQFQEALMSSVIASRNINFTSSALISSSSPSITVQVTPTKETGESSLFFCEICVERKEIDQVFRNQACNHSFCSDCIVKHVAIKIKVSADVISCPSFSCKSVLKLDDCRPILPKEVVDRWDDALCEALILASERFYCPFKDCSAMLVAEIGGEVIRESECPICHRLFCARCQVPWHVGVGCEEFQRLSEDERGRSDLLVRNLADENKWKRCPHCKFYVEKTEGCLHITCRCNFQFCYACGSQWTSSHGGCQTN